MKKVCFVINNLSGGGAEKSVVKLAQEFAGNGYESHIIIMGGAIDYGVGDLAVHSLADADKIPATLFERMLDSKLLGELVTEIIRRLMSQYKFSYSFLRRRSIIKLRNKINQLGPFAAVFSNLKGPDSLCIAAALPNLYCCIHRDIYYEIKFKWSDKVKFRQLREWLGAKRDQHFYKGQNLITVSKELRDATLALGIKPAAIHSIYNLFDFDAISNLAKQYDPEEDDYIIYLGRFTQEKRLEMLLDAYRLSGIPQKLLLFGYGYEEGSILKKIARDNLQARVVIKKFHKNPYPYVKQAKALVLASDMEGLPTVLIEALILGTPVVSTSCPTGPKEILTGDLAEFLSPPEDTQALADNIRKVIDHPPKIKDEYIAKFHKDVNFRKYLALVEDDNKRDI